MMDMLQQFTLPSNAHEVLKKLVDLCHSILL